MLAVGQGREAIYMAVETNALFFTSGFLLCIGVLGLSLQVMFVASVLLDRRGPDDETLLDRLDQVAGWQSGRPVVELPDPVARAEAAAIPRQPAPTMGAASTARPRRAGASIAAGTWLTASRRCSVRPRRLSGRG